MNRQTFNEINITPLTDIFLVLLIIMMVIAPILDQQGLSLAIPEYVEKSSINKESKLITVTVTQDNKYLIDDNEVFENDLLVTIKEMSQEKPDGLLIQASGNSTHQSVVRVMDSARNAGVQSISIVEL
ncbi:MAG: biopolymer transporter ExbD [Candidatus Gastranaerophilales bacterium]|nr:biopolymer transporter ExbD [Candidatus Gastranaerophilales bacterium]